jgi:hypothetical protein
MSTYAPAINAASTVITFASTTSFMEMKAYFIISITLIGLVLFVLGSIFFKDDGMRR